MNPDQSGKWPDMDVDDVHGYPLSPEITVINKFNNHDKPNDKDFVTLIHEGNGTFTLPSGDFSTNNPAVEKSEKISTMLQEKEKGPNTVTTVQEIGGGTIPTGNKAFGNEEGARASSKLEKNGGVRERLSKETLSGKSLTIIISCANKRIFTNPSTTRKILDNSEFKKYMLGPIEVKGKGKSVKLEVKSEIETEIGLRNINNLATHSVRVWSPRPTAHTKPNQRIGVISPIDLDTNLLEEFVPFIRLTDKDARKCNIVEAKRFNKRGRDLELVKIVFDGEFLPEKIIWNNLIYKVRPYIYNPIRCYKCQDYGHGISSCTGRDVCPYCMGRHKLDDCLREDEVFCCHCHLRHYVGDRDCEFFKQAAIIEDKKQKGEITYQESKLRFNALNNKTLEQLLNNSKPEKVNDKGYSTDNVRKGQIRNKLKVNNHELISKNNSQSDIATQNRFDILSEDSDDESENSSCDFFDMNTFNRSKKYKSSNNRNRSKNSNKSYANVVKSPQNNNSDVRDNMMMPIRSSGNKDTAMNDQNKNYTEKDKNIDRENNTNQHESNRLCFDFSNNEFKESFFHQILNKVKRFSKRTPLKSLDFWFSFVFDLFDFVGQQFENSD